MKREYYKELWSFRWNGQTSQKTQLTKTDLGFRLKKKKQIYYLDDVFYVSVR